ncbi:unnamed protein product [Kuraishia capsulata CBS 1993]|uniref:Major facilitator superfamily (MFS) profile domain-containing protein n=1 Tax=Kuraishia capsulata CBS 1993 TaxID=1382522 RepID=W6MMQ0_9ASCO|nr:uncharacterized protein KUCA_T00003825001 [Kuraishia capsulata CBS 1993]CDK27846.1 unnamed protein product [Kuraishia capsulata CBS 1993]
MNIINTLLHRVEAFREKNLKRFQNQYLIFFVVATSQLLDSSNITAVVTTLSQIQEKYDATYPTASWALSAYALCYSSFIMITGRLGDIVGHHIIYTTGLFLLAIFLLVTAVAENLYVLIVFRALQGIAAAMTIPSSYAIVGHTFTGKALNMALAGITAVTTMGASFGFLVGGAFYSTSVGYRGVFFLFAGLAFLASFLSLLCVKHTPTSPAKLSNLDHYGVAVMLGGALLLVTGLTEGGNRWKSPKAYVPIIVGVLMIALFLLWEKRLYRQFAWSRNSDLLIPGELWRIPNFIPLIMIMGLNFGSMFTQALANVEIYQYVSHHSAIISALQAFPNPITIFFCTFIVGAVFGKIPPKYCIFVGTALNVVSGVLLSRQGADTHSYWRFGFMGLVVLGIGVALTLVNTLNSLMVSCPLSLQGLLSGAALTSAQLFVAASSAAMSSIVGDVTIGDSVEEQHKLLKKYRNVYYLSVGLAGAAFVVNFFVKNVSVTSPENNSHIVESGTETNEFAPANSKTETANQETKCTKTNGTDDSIHEQELEIKRDAYLNKIA